MDNIKWIKESLDEFKKENKQDHQEILNHLSHLNGTVDNNQNKIIKIEQKQKDHFFFHQHNLNLKKHTDNLSRAQAVLIISVIQIIAMIIIAFAR